MNLDLAKHFKRLYTNFLKQNEELVQFINNHRYIKGFTEIPLNEFNKVDSFSSSIYSRSIEGLSLALMIIFHQFRSKIILVYQMKLFWMPISLRMIKIKFLILFTIVYGEVWSNLKTNLPKKNQQSVIVLVNFKNFQVSNR